MLGIVGCCWVMLASFGHPTQQNHVGASAVEKFRRSCICFDIPLLTTMEYQQNDLRYETRQFPSDEREGGCSCRPMFNKKRVLIERGKHVGKLPTEKGC